MQEGLQKMKLNFKRSQITLIFRF